MEVQAPPGFEFELPMLQIEKQIELLEQSAPTWIVSGSVGSSSAVRKS
jgi:hypothetical protein